MTQLVEINYFEHIIKNFVNFFFEKAGKTKANI